MSQLVDLYLRTQKLRPTQARAIPDQEVNFFDRTDAFQKGWTNGQDRGSPTSWRDAALQFYNTELRDIVIPESFSKLENEIELNRWNPDVPFYTPGQPVDA